MSVALRVARNRSIWEDADPSELLRHSFSRPDGEPDLSLSVYEVVPEQVTRAIAEHVVSLTNPAVPDGALDLDLAGLAPLTESLGRTEFDFTRNAHRELALGDESSLLALIVQVKQAPNRRLSRSRSDVMKYVLLRDGAGDPEWKAALAAHPKWRDAVAKFRRRSG